ncbi:MAG: hypothetical protein ACYC5F_11175 [Thermoleophilia bacterium]
MFNKEGSFRYEVDISKASVSPVDLREWMGVFALLEANSSPNSVVVVDKTGTVVSRVDLPDNLADLSRALRIGRGGELLALEAGTWIHQLCDPSGASLSLSAMAQRQTEIALQYGEPFTLAAPGGQVKQTVTASKTGEQYEFAIPGGIGGVSPLGCDRAGNYYFVVDTVSGEAGAPISVDRRVVKLDQALKPLGFAKVDLSNSVVTSTRTLDVSADGDLYVMTAASDGVHIATAQFAPEDPALAPRVGDLGARNLDSVVSSVAAPAGIPGWTRSNGDNLGYSYYNINWYCSSGAYSRSNENLNSNQAADNIRPHFITGYNRTWQWIPYCWGGWDTTSFFLNTVNDTNPGRDAGDIGSDYSNCAMNDYGNTTSYPCCGVDCSGFVTRLWGLTDHKRNVYMLMQSDLSYPVNLGVMTMGDVFIKYQPSTKHVIWYRYPQGNGYNCYESTTWNNYDRVANTYRDYTSLQGYYGYRYRYWGQ